MKFAVMFLSTNKCVFCVCEFRESKDGGKGVVLLQPSGQEVSNRAEDKQGNRSWVLEGYWERQGDLQFKDKFTCWNEENPSFLQG